MARISINVGEKIDEKLKEYAEFMGMTKSGLCAYIVAQNIMQMESTKSMITKSFDEAIREKIKADE